MQDGQPPQIRNMVSDYDLAWLLRSLRADPGFPTILDEDGHDRLYTARNDEGRGMTRNELQAACKEFRMLDAMARSDGVLGGRLTTRAAC